MFNSMLRGGVAASVAAIALVVLTLGGPPMTMIASAQDAAVVVGQAPTSTIDFLAPLAAVLPVLVEAIMSVIGLAALFLIKLIRDKWKIDMENSYRAIEEKHRGALHSAVGTALNAGLAKLGPNLKLDVGSPLAAYVVNSVLASVPDAVNALKPSNEWILKAASAKQNEQETIGAARLTTIVEPPTFEPPGRG